MPRKLAVALACMVALAVPARAADLTVLSAGAITAVAKSVVADYEKSSGVTVVMRTDTSGGLSKRVLGDEAFDVVLTSQSGIADLEKAGKLAPGSAIKLAKVGIGLGVKMGAPAPDITTVEAFKAALLAAPSVAYVDPASGGTSGIYLSNLFRALGIADALAPKSVLVRGGFAAEAVADGRAALALQQVSEILGVHGVVLVGRLPESIQLYTTYAGAISAATGKAADARAFLEAMASPTAKSMIAARGMTDP
ncbi:MAG: substrate-binding domain-containing protein [Acetobacteraceae bacterium]